MSQENVEIVRRMLDARNRGDAETVMAYAADDIEFDLSASPGPFAGVYKGHEQVMRLWKAWSEVFSEMIWEAEELVARGDAVIVPVRFRSRGRGSGVETVARAVHVYWLRDGKVVRYRQCQNWPEALEAVGPRTEASTSR
jgi:ketosteroid isomerase-like protein